VSTGILNFMSARPDRERRRAIRLLQRCVRRVLLDWDPIGGVPGDEYDCMTWPLVRMLDDRASTSEISAWLHTDFAEHFSLAVSAASTFEVARRLSALREEQDRR
jgi:hypothetical protein